MEYCLCSIFQKFEDAVDKIALWVQINWWMNGWKEGWMDGGKHWPTYSVNSVFMTSGVRLNDRFTDSLLSLWSIDFQFCSLSLSLSNLKLLLRKTSFYEICQQCYDLQKTERNQFNFNKWRIQIDADYHLTWFSLHIYIDNLLLMPSQPWRS